MSVNATFNNRTHIDANKIDTTKISASQSGVFTNNYVKISENNASWQGDDLSYDIINGNDGDASNDIAVIYNGDTAIGFTDADNVRVQESTTPIVIDMDHVPTAVQNIVNAQNKPDTSSNMETETIDAEVETEEEVEVLTSSDAEVTETVETLEPVEEFTPPDTTEEMAEVEEADTSQLEQMVPEINVETIDEEESSSVQDIVQLRKDLKEFAMQYDGKMLYSWGGKDLNTGVDCSGFVCAVYREMGIPLEGDSSSLRNVGTEVNGIENAVVGDIICFDGHVAIYMGDGKMIDAIGQEFGIKCRDVNNKKAPIITIRRVIQ